MASRYGESVILDGNKIKEALSAAGVHQTMFAKCIGISDQTLINALKGVPVSDQTEDKITNGLFKEKGYFRAVIKKEEPKAESQKVSLEALDTIADFVDDIKATQESILQQLKTMTTLQARLLALWEGERNDTKGKDSAVSEKAS